MDPSDIAQPNEENEDLADIDDIGLSDNDPYPAGTSPLTHIIFSGLLGEHSNAPPLTQGIPLVRRPRFMPRAVFAALPPRVQPYLFALYQTGMHGPQNGWKFVCIEEGNDPEKVGKYLEGLGRIERESKGMIIFQPPRPACDIDQVVIGTAENDVNVLLLEDSPDDYSQVISHLLQSTSLPTISLSTQSAIPSHPGRSNGTIDPLSKKTQGEIMAEGKFEAVVSADRASLFVVSDDSAEGGVLSRSDNPDHQPKRYLVLVKQGHDPGAVQRKCTELVDGGIEAGSFIIFGSAKRQEGVIVYDQQGNLKQID